MFVFPTQSHFFNRSTFWCSANKTSITCTMYLTKSVSTSNKSNSFFIIHSHTVKSFTNIFCACNRIRISIWTFWININQTHLHCSKWIFKITFTSIAFVSKPFFFFTPVDIFFWGPNIRTSTTVAKSLTAH